MPDTSLRYLALLEAIPRYPDCVSVEQIRAALERRGFPIDRRSIQRDLQKLAASFHLISEAEGRQYRWSCDPDARPRMFPSMDEHTALSFQMAEALLRPLLAPETLDMIEPWFRIAGERLATRRGGAAKWREKIHVLPLGLRRQPPRIDPQVRDEVYQGLLHEVPLRIRHLARGSGAVKEHLISPLGLVVRDHLTYLVAAKQGDGRILQFALHRTKEAECCEGDFQRPRSFNLQAYAEEGFGFPLGQSGTVTLRLRLCEQGAISVSECPLAGRQSLKPDGDGVVLTAEVPNNLELRQWIRSLGSCAEVLEPGFLRAEVAEEARALASVYRPSRAPG